MVASLGYFGGASADLHHLLKQKAEYRTNVINTPAVQAELELLKLAVNMDNNNRRIWNTVAWIIVHMFLVRIICPMGKSKLHILGDTNPRSLLFFFLLFYR